MEVEINKRGDEIFCFTVKVNKTKTDTIEIKKSLDENEIYIQIKKNGECFLIEKNKEKIKSKKSQIAESEFNNIVNKIQYIYNSHCFKNFKLYAKTLVYFCTDFYNKLDLLIKICSNNYKSNEEIAHSLDTIQILKFEPVRRDELYNEVEKLINILTKNNISEQLNQMMLDLINLIRAYESKYEEKHKKCVNYLLKLFDYVYKITNKKITYEEEHIRNFY